MDPPVYGLRHDKIVSLAKLGESYDRPILFRMAMTPRISETHESKEEIIGLADRGVVAMMCRTL
jgi:hypothetical protein